jgi:predicted AAA+ superfamily ATPase
MSISEKLTPDYGKILENIVFIYLRHYTDRIYYARTKHGREIDFVTMASGTVMSEHTSVHLWQVCYELDDIDTLNRELEALKDVENSYVISKATIVTYDTEDIRYEGTLKIDIIPAWKLLLDKRKNDDFV